MGNKRNRRGSKKGKFNRPGGIHNVLVKRKITLKDKKLQTRLDNLKTVKSDAYFVRKRKEGLSIVLSKLVLKKAKRYKCLKSSISNKLFLHSDEQHFEGNRIMNLDKFRKYISEISVHTALCEQARIKAVEGESVVTLHSEKSNGLYSILSSKCGGCGAVFNIDNSNKFGESHQHDVNVRCVWGSMVTGGGCSSLNEAMGTMGIPGMNEKKYSEIEREIGELWKSVLENEMLTAGKEEKELAIEDGDFFMGVPAISVICDGGWSKRSHKHTYNAMAGVGVIFGARTKKLLHIGIRNKLCYVCSRAQTENKEPKQHTCFKNWDCSSQAMESDIIMNGFLECEEKHGIRYMRMIGDGDSSVYANIIKYVPVWGAHVEKIECANHATKCLRANLERLVTEKKHYKGRGNLNKNNIRRITAGVRCAIVMRSKESNRTLAIKKLRQDIRNAGRHVLGIHDMCSTDFCKHQVKEKEIDTVDSDNEPAEEDEDIIVSMCDYWQETVKELTADEEMSLRKGGTGKQSVVSESLLKDVFLFLNRLADKAHRLIGNFTSNLAESWMHIRAKFDGGKMLNKCFRGSFFARCYGGALRTMLGPAWSPQVYQRITGTRPDRIYLSTYHERSRKYVNTKISASKKDNIIRRKSRKNKSAIESATKKAKQQYGEVLEDTEDISSNQLDRECQAYFRKQICAVNVKDIELKTKGQSNNSLWHDERKKRLTSSNFGEIMARSVNNNRPNIVKKMLYSKFKGNIYTLRGLNEEENARIEYVNMKNKDTITPQIISIETPGLMIDDKYPYLATSSDGIVVGAKGPEGLIEIKTVLQNKKTLIRQAAENDRTFCLKIEHGSMKLKRNHKFYYQIQGQLNIIGYEWCDIIIRRINPHDMFIERIHRDKCLWEDVMVPKLTAFYNTHLLPELAVPRNETLSGIRKPSLPWYQPLKQTRRKIHDKRRLLDTDSDDEQPPVEILTATPLLLTEQVNPTVEVVSDTPLPSTSYCKSKRQRKLKFVGRRIKHQWKEDDDTLTWYFGTVLSVTKGRDGQTNAVYQVLYDGEGDSYDVESLQTDYNEGSLMFIDL